jgi:hypothetical protein
LRYEEGVYKPYSLLTRGMIKKSPYLTQHIVYSKIDKYINQNDNNNNCKPVYGNIWCYKPAQKCDSESSLCEFRDYCFWNQSNPRMGVYMIYKDIIKIGYTEKVKRKRNSNENKSKNKKKSKSN